MHLSLKFERIKEFERNQRNQRSQRVKCSVNFLYPNPETSLTLGMPRDMSYCPVHSIPFSGLPYSPSSIPYLQEQHTHGTQHTQWIQGKAQGVTQAKTWQEGLSQLTQKERKKKPSREAKYKHLICSGITSEEGWDTCRPCVRWNLIR